MIAPALMKRVEAWLAQPFDAPTVAETRALLDKAQAGGGTDDLEERFGLDLKFGTGGLRGIMGVGSNRMNAYTVGRATQGIADELLEGAAKKETLSAVVGYDTRHNSRFFAEVTAGVFAGNGIKTCLFSLPRPTPMLSFATLKFGTTVGVMITASHNPPEYNGYKLYAGNGQQIMGQRADNMVKRVGALPWNAIQRLAIDDARAKGLIVDIGEDFDAVFLEAIRAGCIDPTLCKRAGASMKIVFSGLHGTGGALAPRALGDWGFQHVTVVAKQHEGDGAFPTVKSPNPEEPAALAMGIQQAVDQDADIVLATDPDADRIGCAARRVPGGEFALLNGNDIAVLLAHYQLESRKQAGKMPPNGRGAVISTIVTSRLLETLAKSYGAQYFDTLTGFKYIGELMNAWDHNNTLADPKTVYLFGAEESHGYLVGKHTRDKDGIGATCSLAEVAAHAREQGHTLHQRLAHIHGTFGVYVEAQLTKTLPGLKGMTQIQTIMEKLRANPPKSMVGLGLTQVKDYKLSTVTDAAGKQTGTLAQPKEEVIALQFGESLLITGRPSGTEPKIKFYFSANQRNGLPFAMEKVGDVRKELLALIDKAKAEVEAFIQSAIG